MATKEEKIWMTAIARLGCICCHLQGHPNTPAVVHHLLRGGRRIGHLHTIPLCPDHHQHTRSGTGKIARHPHRVQFEKAYGTEQYLLETTRELVKEKS